MPKPLRHAPGGMVFHCINRGNGRNSIFEDDRDYAAFETVLAEALAQVPLRLLAYCLMPNHWEKNEGDVALHSGFIGCVGGPHIHGTRNRGEAGGLKGSKSIFAGTA